MPWWVAQVAEGLLALADFAFLGTPINKGLLYDLAGLGFLASQRNVRLSG